MFVLAIAIAKIEEDGVPSTKKKPRCFISSSRQSLKIEVLSITSLKSIDK
jgi:hypothetical protein